MPQLPLGPRRILVVEPDPVGSALLEEAFAPYADLQLCQDGETALEVLDDWKPELVVTALALPDGDGAALAARLRARPVAAEVPILVLTPVSDRAALARCTESGVDDFCVTPFDVDELLARVAALYLRRRLGR
jgi:two-component system KDP operon response regulator KdpE